MRRRRDFNGGPVATTTGTDEKPEGNGISVFFFCLFSVTSNFGCTGRAGDAKELRGATMATVVGGWKKKQGEQQWPPLHYA